MTEHKHIVITGASGGLGRALASYYAAPGIKLSLCGRNEQELMNTEAIVLEKGATIFKRLFEIRDYKSLEGFVEDAVLENGPIDLIIANAGICRGIDENDLEKPEDTIETFDVNAKSMILTATLGARSMLKEGKGQIAIISSQAGRIPLINTPSYSATKAAARFYGLSLREKLTPKGIKVTVVCPGFIKTQMLDSFTDIAIPLTFTATEAAEYIGNKLKKAPREIRFPFLLSLLISARNLLPQPLLSFVIKKFSFKVLKKDKDIINGTSNNTNKDTKGKS
jgi:short-subunit dehydrogenase